MNRESQSRFPIFLSYGGRRMGDEVILVFFVIFGGKMFKYLLFSEILI
jgi:hypothetical protein